SPTPSSSADRVRRPVLRIVAAVALCATLAVAAEGPREVVRRLADQVLAVLKDRSLASDVKRRRIEDIVYTGVDFDVLSRLVLARNWTRFTPDEQQRFEQEFKQHLSLTYGKSIDSYKNEELQITGDREEARGDWTVKSKILRGGGSDDVLVDYR